MTSLAKSQSQSKRDDLKDRVRIALDEARILVLGVQVLIGFDFDAIFQKEFPLLPESSQYVKLASLLVTMVALGLTLAPASYHQITERGEEDPRCLGYITTVTGIALLPFALGLGGELYVVVQKIVGFWAAIATCIASILLALVLWYGIELIRRVRTSPNTQQERRNEVSTMASQPGQTPIKDKIQFVLTETRVVLPGVQALLGFQVIIVLTEPFDKLDDAMKYLHLGSMLIVAISMMMLMAPAAYHRLAEQGESTEHLHKFSSAMVLGAMASLALGMAGDLYIIVRQVTRSDTAALVISLLTLAFYYGLWFGYSLFRRHDYAREERTKAQANEEFSHTG